ncbi:hypothetical protein K504DRAFT_159827 [Pleomassaria siparia CBS 279.74]|uniref:Uncharacterized protein n=1 Tax=Pleomassaria siparia CBS 279.74 TaxID=1314801 RepID=A0A6G1JU97_9PLEO|nr:hypothetical protein K504DRAFT_159827 [Pleomassaria siparia CBS 279.74]
MSTSSASLLLCLQPLPSLPPPLSPLLHTLGVLPSPIFLATLPRPASAAYAQPPTSHTVVWGPCPLPCTIHT